MQNTDGASNTTVEEIPRPNADPVDPTGPSPDRRLTRIAARVGDLPALPQMALRVLHLTDGDDWRLDELEEAILRDHTLAARFLRLANSPYYGVRHEITTLSRALNLLGIRKIRSVVLAASVEGLHERKRGSFPGKVLWEHALAVAFVSQHLAQQCQSGNPEEAFMAGLLHDIGRPVMDQHGHEQYQQVVELVKSQVTPTLLEAERSVFEFDHTEVGGIVAHAWNLPPVIAHAIRFHHEPQHAPDNRTEAATVNLANALCVKYGVGFEKDPELELVELPSIELLGLDPDQLEKLTADLLYIVRPIWSI